MLGEISVELGTILSFLRSLVYDTREMFKFVKHSDIEKLIRALRKIYFYEGTPIVALRQIARGENIDSLQIASMSHHLEHSEPEIVEALASFEEQVLAANLAIPLQTIRKIREMCQSKMGIRETLDVAAAWASEEIAAEGRVTDEVRYSAVAICALIDELNREIEIVESELRRLSSI